MAKWLKCIISKGMFSDEFTIVVQTHNGDKVSVFVPRESADDQQGRVRVRVIQGQGTTMAVLPDENQSVVEVESSDLIPV